MLLLALLCGFITRVCTHQQCEATHILQVSNYGFGEVYYYSANEPTIAIGLPQHWLDEFLKTAYRKIKRQQNPESNLWESTALLSLVENIVHGLQLARFDFNPYNVRMMEHSDVWGSATNRETPQTRAVNQMLRKLQCEFIFPLGEWIRHMQEELIIPS